MLAHKLMNIDIKSPTLRQSQTTKTTVDVAAEDISSVWPCKGSRPRNCIHIFKNKQFESICSGATRSEDVADL